MKASEMKRDLREFSAALWIWKQNNEDKIRKAIEDSLKANDPNSEFPNQMFFTYKFVKDYLSSLEGIKEFGIIIEAGYESDFEVSLRVDSVVPEEDEPSFPSHPYYSISIPNTVKYLKGIDPLLLLNSTELSKDLKKELYDSRIRALTNSMVLIVYSYGSALYDLLRNKKIELHEQDNKKTIVANFSNIFISMLLEAPFYLIEALRTRVGSNIDYTTVMEVEEVLFGVKPNTKYLHDMFYESILGDIQPGHYINITGTGEEGNPGAPGVTYFRLDEYYLNTLGSDMDHVFSVRSFKYNRNVSSHKALPNVDAGFDKMHTLGGGLTVERNVGEMVEPRGCIKLNISGSPTKGKRMSQEIYDIWQQNRFMRGRWEKTVGEELFEIKKGRLQVNTYEED